MQTLDRILNLLMDGEWHTINEISANKRLLKLSMTTLMHALNFLAEYNFIELSPGLSGPEAKLTPHVEQFLKEIRWIERAEPL